MRGIAIFLLLWASTTTCLAQQHFTRFEIEVKADRIAFDNLLNLYHIRGTEMVKYDKNGDFQFRYSDKQLGAIGPVDITFPMRPLLVYPGINYIVMLDNTLSNNRGNINLLNHGITLGTLACNSIQNHFWFYDAMNFKLIRTNENFRSVQETGNLAQILRIARLEPNYMVEFANRLYVNNPSTGILVFDIFGTYIKTIPVIGLEEFQINESELIYFKDGAITRHHLKTFQSETVMLPEGVLHAKLQKNRVAILMKDKIAVLQLN